MATVLEVEDLGYTTDYVYDLETEVGTFSTPEGLILKNTDSCYVKFNVDKNKFPDDDTHAFMHEHFRLAKECAEVITKTFKPPIELEFEKVMYPFLLAKKKRYAYLEWTNPEKADKIDYKGIQLARRDNCKYIREISMGLLNNLLYDKDVSKAKLFATNGVRDLLENRVGIDKLIISKGLNKYYKVDGENVIWYDAKVPSPHVRLAQKLRVLDPMGHPKPPDRVPYVFVKSKNENVLQFERVEHPDYLDGKQIDSLYYLDKQLISPITDIMELVMDSPWELYERDREKYVVSNKKGMFGFNVQNVVKNNMTKKKFKEKRQKDKTKQSKLSQYF